MAVLTSSTNFPVLKIAFPVSIQDPALKTKHHRYLNSYSLMLQSVIVMLRILQLIRVR
jgi:hypothetical protein